jgi:hypothetical protein
MSNQEIFGYLIITSRKQAEIAGEVENMYRFFIWLMARLTRTFVREV